MLVILEASTATHIHANKINYKVRKVPINNSITAVAGPHINNITQCVNGFRIVVSNNYHIYVVLANVFAILYRRLLFICVGGSCFLGGG